MTQQTMDICNLILDSALFDSSDIYIAFLLFIVTFIILGMMLRNSSFNGSYIFACACTFIASIIVAYIGSLVISFALLFWPFTLLFLLMAYIFGWVANDEFKSIHIYILNKLIEYKNYFKRKKDEE